MSQSEQPSGSFYKVANEELISKELDEVDNMKKLSEEVTLLNMV